MGRIKTRRVKAATLELADKYSDEFTTDFDKNKEVVSARIGPTSKKLRNIIAGYATRLKKSEN